MKYCVLLGRIFFAAIFIMSAPGLFKTETIHMAAAKGVPDANYLVPLAGVIALVGGLSVLLGYRGQSGAWLLVVFLIPVTFVMHNFWAVADPAAAKMQQINFLKNVALLGGALMITYFGTGPLSLDWRRHSFHAEDHDTKAHGSAHA